MADAQTLAWDTESAWAFLIALQRPGCLGPLWRSIDHGTFDPQAPPKPGDRLWAAVRQYCDHDPPSCFEAYRSELEQLVAALQKISLIGYKSGAATPSKGASEIYGEREKEQYMKLEEALSAYARQCVLLGEALLDAIAYEEGDEIYRARTLVDVAAHADVPESWLVNVRDQVRLVETAPEGVDKFNKKNDLRDYIANFGFHLLQAVQEVGTHQQNESTRSAQPPRRHKRRKSKQDELKDKAWVLRAVMWRYADDLQLGKLSIDCILDRVGVHKSTFYNKKHSAFAECYSDWEGHLEHRAIAREVAKQQRLETDPRRQKGRKSDDDLD